jgi:hypothetical protein
MFDELLDLHQSLRQHSRFQRELAEVGFVRITEGRPRYNLSEITDRLEALHEGDDSGEGPIQSPSSPPAGNKSSKRDAATRSSPSKSSDPSSPDDGADPSSDSDARSDEDDDTETTELKNIDRRQWGTFLQAVKNPTRAFLKNCTVVARDGDILSIHFDGKHANQIERLKRDRQEDHLRAAMNEVFDREYEVELNVTEEDEADRAEKSESTDSESDSGEEFLRQSRELLERE